MQNFKSYDSHQNLVGLIINPESDGNYLNKEELTELFPKFKEIIKNKQNSIINKIIDQINITENGYTFQDKIGHNFIETIIGICFTEITEKIIIEQIFDIGPSIRHRIFHFDFNETNNSITVKFIQLGKDKMNDFKSAISCIDTSLY